MAETALQRLTQAILTNKSGGSVAQGDVVIIDSTTAASFTTTTTAGYVNGVIGVVIEPNGIASNALGMVAFSGPVPKVNLSGSASLADLFKTHTAAKQAVRHAAGIQSGDFGIALGTGTTPPALLWGLPAGATGAGSGDFVGPGSAVDGNLVVFDGTTGKLGKDGGAPSRVLIATTSPSGTATVTFSSIPATYTHLVLMFAARSTQSAANVDANLFLNNDSTASNYRSTALQSYGNGAGTTGGNMGDQISLDGEISGDTGPANAFSMGIVRIPFYANTGFNKQMFIEMAHRRDASSIWEIMENWRREWESAAAVSRIDVVLALGNYKAGSIFNLYGEV